MKNDNWKMENLPFADLLSAFYLLPSAFCFLRSAVSFLLLASFPRFIVSKER
jgi:hypothetical protein